MSEPEYILFPMDDGSHIIVRPAGKFFEDLRMKDCIIQQLTEERAALTEKQKPGYKEVYERYRRRHAKDPRVTIKDVCKEMGADYDNIRAAKSRATKKQKPPRKRHKKTSQGNQE